MAKDQDKDLTAEQKLLKMIETSTDEKSSGGGGSEDASQSNPFGILRLVKVINLFLIVAVLASVVFLGYAIVTGMDDVARKVEIELNSDLMDNEAGQDTSIPTIERLAYYTSAFESRDIFQPYEEKSTAVAKESNSEAVQGLTDSYRLVGIAWFDTVDSASVMLEDKNQKVTYFLQKGEKLGDIQVKTIYADSALLAYENEEIMIRYDTPQP